MTGELHWKHVPKHFFLLLLYVVLMATPVATIANTSIGNHPPGCVAPSLKLPAWTNARGWDNDAFQSTISLANVSGDARLELVGRDPIGMGVQGYDIDPDRGWWGAWLPRYSADDRQSDLSNPVWMSPEHYSSTRFIDLDGDGIDEMVAHDAGDAGMGLVAYRFIGGDDEAAGNWVIMNDAGFVLPTDTDWTRPEYYQTVQVGRLLPGDAEQLVVRSIDGVIGIQWDIDSGNFKSIDGMADKGPFPDSEGWYRAWHYPGIRLADIDGDGFDEIIGRGSVGLFGFKYEQGVGWNLFGQPAGLVGDSIAGDPQYYETITWGYFQDKTRESLAIRTVDGVQLIKWDMTTNTWVQLTIGDGLFAGGVAIPQFSTSFRAADIDANGLDELHLNNLVGSGLQSYKFPENTDAGNWQLVNTGNMATEHNLPANGATIHLGDINGDGLPEAIGRTEFGLETYFYDAATARWEQNFSCGFPEFPGQQSNAYKAMNKLRFEGATEFRHEYNDSSANISNILFLNANSDRPVDDDNSYTQKDWSDVRMQLLQELDWANSALAVFADQRTTFDERYTSQWESMDTVGKGLLDSLKEKETFNIEVILESLLEGAIDLGTDGIAGAAFKDKEAKKLMLKGIGDIFGAVAAGAMGHFFPDDVSQGTVDQLKDEIQDKKQLALAQLSSWSAEITGHGTQQGDLGSMAAVGSLHQRAYWPANFSDDPFVQDKSRWSFKRWLYQQILTSVYDIHIYDCAPGFCPKPTPSRTRVCYTTSTRPAYALQPNDQGKTDCQTEAFDTAYLKWVYIAIEKKGSDKAHTLPDEVINTLTEKLSVECGQDGGYLVDSCNLSLDINNLLKHQNGWGFNVTNHSTIVDNQGAPKKNLSCAGLDATIVGTEGPDKIIGTPGPDVIVSLGGKDVIRSGEGDDVVCSGDGDDRVYGGLGDDRLILGYGNDQGYGGRGNDWLSGESGNDALRGARGNDVLEGGLGDDILDGGKGYDILHGGSELDFTLCYGEEQTNCSSEEY